MSDLCKSLTRTTTTLLLLLLFSSIDASAAITSEYLTVPSTSSVGFSSYGNVFVNPDPIVDRYLNQNQTSTSDTEQAEETILAWADLLNSQGPWSVMNKSATAASGDKHDYMSWAPYWWPNCTGVGNTTALTDEQVWVTCPYYQLDGQFNPDVRLVNDTGAFQAMSDSVLYNSLSYIISGNTSYESYAVEQIYTWFLNESTYMNPNLNYAQVIRGPDSSMGTHTGVLDLKCLTKVVSGILLLRKGNSTAYTDDIDQKLGIWAGEYVNWLKESNLAAEESWAANNHGTFYYNQLAALQILVGNTTDAQNTTRTYFQEQYLDQIEANGEQPFEAVRTRPYHYRCYNLIAMITNARLAEYVGLDFWNTTTKYGSTIKTALDYTMTISPGEDTASELYLSMMDVSNVYGDPSGTYGAFLSNASSNYIAQPYYLWDYSITENSTTTDDMSSSTSPSPSATSSTAAANAQAKSSDGRRSGGNFVISTLLGIVIYGPVHIYLL